MHFKREDSHRGLLTTFAVWRTIDRFFETYGTRRIALPF